MFALIVSPPRTKYRLHAHVHTRERVCTYVTPPFNWLRVQRAIFCILWWWLLEKPVLKSFCYNGTSSLAKTLMSRSRCFCFPLTTYTHGTTSPFPTADRRLLLSTWQVISLSFFWRKKKQQTLDISHGTWPTIVSSFHMATANGDQGGGGLYSRESVYSKISPLPSLGHVYC